MAEDAKKPKPLAARALAALKKQPPTVQPVDAALKRFIRSASRMGYSAEQISEALKSEGAAVSTATVAIILAPRNPADAQPAAPADGDGPRKYPLTVRFERAPQPHQTEVLKRAGLIWRDGAWRGEVDQATLAGLRDLVENIGGGRIEGAQS